MVALLYCLSPGFARYFSESTGTKSRCPQQQRNSRLSAQDCGQCPGQQEPGHPLSHGLGYFLRFLRSHPFQNTEKHPTAVQGVYRQQIIGTLDKTTDGRPREPSDGRLKQQSGGRPGGGTDKLPPRRGKGGMDFRTGAAHPELRMSGIQQPDSQQMSQFMDAGRCRRPCQPWQGQCQKQ